jgi:hypothetical protein
MAERRELWLRHNRLDPVRPMILVFPEGAWRELLPEEALRGEGELARAYERDLRTRLYYQEHLPDDTVIESTLVVSKAVRSTGWGLEARQIPSPEALGAWTFDPVLREPADLAKLHAPEIEHDEANASQEGESFYLLRYPPERLTPQTGANPDQVADNQTARGHRPGEPAEMLDPPNHQADGPA